LQQESKLGSEGWWLLISGYFCCMGKRLIINADDFGLDAGVSQAILELARAGAISSTTIMANLASQDDLQDIAKAEGISTGLHFNILEGKPLAPPESVFSLLDRHGRFPGINALLTRYMLKKVHLDHIEKELKAQVEMLLDFGISISHADSHKHIHQFPFIGKFIQEMFLRKGVRKVRNCYVTDSSEARNKIYRGVWEFARLENRYLRSPETLITSFWGITENYEEAFKRSLHKAFRSHSDVEFMTHPAVKNDKGSKLNRRGEYEFWKSMKWKEYLSDESIELIDYRSL
jgi:predicted glycoside hydrolase/deacetylase ChbG (UPF0249 family)